MGRKANAVIWNYFKQCDDGEAECLAGGCCKKFKRSNGSTSTMIAHLCSAHGDAYKAYLHVVEQKDSTTGAKDKKPSINMKRKADESLIISSDAPDLPTKRQRQLTINKSVQKFAFDSVEAQSLNRSIAEMIICEYLPTRITEAASFKRLMKKSNPRYIVPTRNYFAYTIIPNIVTRMKETVRKEINGVDFFSFTTDTWSHAASTVSLLSLMAHWLDKEFKRHNVVLAGHPLEGSHTAVNVMATISGILSKWDIDVSNIHLIVRDAGANMVCALNEEHLNVANVHCLAHKFQLTIKDAIFEQSSVKELIAKCQRTARHFNKSTTARENLQKIQEKLDLPQHAIINDCVMRWNSTYEMVRRVKEQSNALRQFKFENNAADIPKFSMADVDLMGKVMDILEPIASKTKEISGDDATISIYIPMVRSLLTKLKTDLESPTAAGVKTILRAMLTSLNNRFNDDAWSNELIIATFLDPRFKDSQKLLRKDIWSTVIDHLKAQFLEFLNSNRSSNTKTSNFQKSSLSVNKKQDFWDFNDDSDEEEGDIDKGNPGVAGFEKELETYRNSRCIAISDCPFDWWSMNANVYPLLARFVRRYLSAPPTSVPSERLFSVAGNIYSNKKRNKLLKENASDLLFAKANLQRLNFNY